MNFNIIHNRYRQKFMGKTYQTIYEKDIKSDAI